MSKGILLGILLQCISATGYMVIVNVTSIKNEWFRTGLMIFFAGIVALIVAGYTVISGQQRLSAIQPKEYIYIAIGSIMVMFVAQVIFFFGVKVSSMTTMAYTMLAFPIISLILELILGRVKLSSLGIYDLVGFTLIAAGYVVFVSKPLP
ncbi:MAG: EamA family transporter [Chloroflexi bacterium]|nr:EamA family transporter [Chloroflexota bacterium]